jgi:hypothetical protein
MTSQPQSLNNDGTRKAAPTTFSLDRRTTPSTFASSNNRSSIGSHETGESSTAASKRNSLTIHGMTDGSADTNRNDSSDIEQPANDGKGSFRSHRNRASNGFLLSAPLSIPTKNVGTTTDAEPMTSHGPFAQELKSKTNLRSPEKKHSNKRRSNVGVGASPLGTTVSSTMNGNGKGVDTTASGRASNGRSTVVDGHSLPRAPAALDVDSAQIVNLALNLSESRRNATRRFVSTPLPQASGALVESIVGGSLRQHLQQQRRVSRNISPKPDRGDRTMGSSRVMTAPNISSPLQSAFDTQEDGKYEYHFSASTLARAEKARHTIELMAQYRRLLHYVQPLKPQATESTTTSSDAGASGSPASSTFRHSRSPSSSVAVPRQLGRPYNPLQYIRNRKVRSRTSRTIDGEAQGFGDLEKVSGWIDTVAQISVTEEYQKADCSMIPKFSKGSEDSASPFGSPQSSTSKGQSAQMKAKRPRVDWITNPADMLADIFWTEQDDNKKLVEDRSGHPIFPQHLELKGPVSRKTDDESDLRKPPTPAKKMEELGVDLKLDTQLPEFKSIKSDSDKLSDWAASKAKQKLKNVAHIHHGHHGSTRERRRLRSRSRSDSSSSDSDVIRPTRRRRSGTGDSNDRSTDILEKQMQEMIAKEARQTQKGGYELASPKIIEFNEKHEPEVREEKSKEPFTGHTRSDSLVARVKNGSSGRASLEVPGVNPRSSLDGLDSLRRSSSQSRANKIAGAFMPMMGRDRSPSRSRPTSPIRTPLSRMGSKIRPLYFRNNDSSRHTELDDENIFIFPPASKGQTPETPNALDRARSLSPPKKTTPRLSDSKPASNAGSIRKGKGEDSGIRGLFKGPRNTVSKVSDYLWKKDASPGNGLASGFSTDDSDLEDLKKVKRESRESSMSRVPDDFDRTLALGEVHSRLADMPSFTSPLERRGRPTQAKDDLLPGGFVLKQQKAERDRNTSTRSKLQDAPRIDVHNASPSTSPDTGPVNRFHRDSSVSEVSSYRQGVEYADARLNSILGIPGGRRSALPITGLSRLEATTSRLSLSEDHRQWSISDVSVNEHRGPTTKREIARVRALLLSSGIKAKEISRRAAELKDLKSDKDSTYHDVVDLTDQDIQPVPKNQEHRLAARILSEDIQHSTHICQASADAFSNVTVAALLTRIGAMQSRLVENLTPMTRAACDEADEVSKDLVTSQTLKVKSISDTMDKMMRRRRRRFRWVRRGGWVMVEWVLVGVMWGVWFLVMLVRIVMGIGRGLVGGVKWLFWL